MSLLVDLAKDVYEFRGRRVAVEDWASFVALEVPKRKGYSAYHSFTTLGARPWRFADASVTCKVGDLELPAMSELELRSPYLNACNGGRRRARWSSHDEEAMFEIGGSAIPHYRRDGMPRGPVVGLDMDASYWQFVEHFSTQVEYRPRSGAWGAVGAPWQDVETLLPMKPLRSSICSAAWRNKFATWGTGDDMHQMRTPHYQPQAWRLLSDYLMSWAVETVGLFQPWAVVVDCVVLDARKAEDFREFAFDRWGATFHLDRAWSPGEQWPWPTARRAGSNLRDVPDAVRQQLARRITGHGPCDAPLFADRGISGELVVTEPPAPEEPEPAPWQARRGFTRWQLVVVQVPTMRAKRGTYQRPSRPERVTYHAGSKPVLRFTLGEVAPPEVRAALDGLLEHQRI